MYVIFNSIYKTPHNWKKETPTKTQQTKTIKGNKMIWSISLKFHTLFFEGCVRYDLNFHPQKWKEKKEILCQCLWICVTNVNAYRYVYITLILSDGIWETIGRFFFPQNTG